MLMLVLMLAAAVVVVVILAAASAAAGGAGAAAGMTLLKPIDKEGSDRLHFFIGRHGEIGDLAVLNHRLHDIHCRLFILAQILPRE